jgi:squalene synthase HpnC
LNKSANQNLSRAYIEAENFARSHYENFPVVSFLIPKELRKHVAVIYKFARMADDIADEGTLEISERKKELIEFRDKLSKALEGKPGDEFWEAVLNTIQERKLNPQYLFDLLSAFEQDITKKRYESFTELLDYCRRSANPVGRLMLELFNVRDERAMKYSDQICTGLQLTNFYQDVSVDYNKDRIYIPQDEMERFQVNEDMINQKKVKEPFKELLKFQTKRNRKFYKEGSELLNYLNGFFKVEIKWTILGGEKILDKIEELDHDVLNHRPTLSKIDYIKLLVKALQKS